MRILILNGPNLNLIGKRETQIYGTDSLHELEKRLSADFTGISLEFFQSNDEGALIDKIHQSMGIADGIVINPGGYSHSSIALADAIAACTIPVIEVHISNIHAREPFRHTLKTGARAGGVISGLGMDGYLLAVTALIRKLENQAR